MVAGEGKKKSEILGGPVEGGPAEGRGSCGKWGGGPKGWGPEGVGARRVGGPNPDKVGPEGWGPEGVGARRVGSQKFRPFFSLSRRKFLLSGGSSRGIWWRPETKL